MREIIVVSIIMENIGIKLTHLPKLLYACLTEANLGVFVPSPMSFSFFYDRDENIDLLSCEPMLKCVW